VIAGVTAYIITSVIDKIKKDSYNYYIAFLDANKTDVYVGPPFTYDAAAVTYLNSGDSGDINVFAKTSSKANEAAKKRTGGGYAVYHDGHAFGDGYYPHYHLAKSISFNSFTLFKNHVWYYPGT
jgi:hypothetical protein